MISGSPRLMRGAVVGIDPFNPTASVVTFQYNPDTLTRALQAQSAGATAGGRSEPMRFTGAPVETIQLELEIDATDQLEAGQTTSVQMGIQPQLAALEMLVYPKTAVVLANTALLAAGVVELIQPYAPLTLFVWGPRRVLPVRISSLRITEEASDENLNPIRAKVAIELRVLSYSDLPLLHPGYALFVAYQAAKEAMAMLGSAGGENTALGASGSVR